MPFRLDDEFRAKVQFITSAEMPNLVYEACKKTGIQSNTVYYQLALCRALADDLGLDYDLLVSHLPAPAGPSSYLYAATKPHPQARYGPPAARAIVDQEVR